jgi:hypothetical protein
MRSITSPTLSRFAAASLATLIATAAASATSPNQGGTITCTAEYTLPNGVKVTSTTTCPANHACGSELIRDANNTVIGVRAICIRVKVSSIQSEDLEFATVEGLE